MLFDWPDTAPVIIHNEVLCFVVNKMESVPFEALLKICIDFYGGTSINCAKETLWKSVIAPRFPGRADMRLIKRKNGVHSKEHSDMEDILKALQVCDKEGVSLPQFCALDLRNIPPVSPEQVDMGVLLGQFHAMQLELGQLKEAVQVLSAAPKTVPSSQTWAQVVESESSKSSAASSAAPPSDKLKSQPKQQPRQPVDVQRRNTAGASKQMLPPRQTQKSAQVLQHSGGQDFITAYKTTRNGRKRKEVKGTGLSSSLKGVAAPPRTAQLFVGRLDPDTTCEAVALHTDMLLGEAGKATVVEIPHCAAKYGYKGFKVQVPVEAFSLVMQADKWPAHVSVKRYYQPKVGQPAVQHSPLSRSASVGNMFDA